jgi:hypothetical protein
LLGASLALLVVSAGATLLAAIRERPAAFALIIYALTASAWYAILTAILGDGYVEIPRHAQLVAPCLSAMLLIIIGALLAAAWTATGRNAAAASAARASAGLALASVAIATIGTVALRGTIAAMPLATGIIDRPKQNAVPDGAVEFVGWALDPRGVGRVELVTDSGDVYRAEYARPYAGARGEPLALYFPSYPDVALPGFVAILPPQAIAAGTLGVRTFVVDVNGVRTEIDRRRLVVR